MSDHAKETNKKSYLLKHPGEKLEPNVAAMITLAMKKRGGITCKESHKISKKLKITPKRLGINIDLMKIKIYECQLKLFGCKKISGNAELLISTDKLDSRLKRNIMLKQHNKRLSCLLAWSIAERLNLEKANVSTACDELGISISQCQLGCF